MPVSRTNDNDTKLAETVSISESRFIILSESNLFQLEKWYEKDKSKCRNTHSSARSRRASCSVLLPVTIQKLQEISKQVNKPLQSKNFSCNMSGGFGVSSSG